MKKIDIVKLISLSFNLVPHSAATYRSVEHDSLVVWPKSNTFTWFSIGKLSGGPHVWLTKVLDIPPDGFEKFLDENDLERNFEYDLLPDIAVVPPVGRRYYSKYIESRGITKETSEYFGLETIGKDTIIPLFNNDSRRVGSMVRRHDTNVNYLKYRKIVESKMCGLWHEKLVNQRYNGNVIIFEGAWSVMRWWQASKETEYDIVPLALLSTNFYAAHPLVYNIDKLVFILDNDINKSGDSVYKQAKKLNNGQQWRYILPDDYPDEMDDETIKKYLYYLYK